MNAGAHSWKASDTKQPHPLPGQFCLSADFWLKKIVYADDSRSTTAQVYSTGTVYYPL